MSERIEGRRPVLAALRAGRVQQVLIAAGAHHAIIDEIRTSAAKRGVQLEEAPKSRLDAMSATGKHQGVIAEAAAIARRGWERALADARDAGRAPFLVALDGIQDPGNLGALIRSAAAFGVDAVLIPEDRAAPLTEVAIKASAGGVEEVEVDTVRSLQAALERAKQLGCWIVTLAERDAEPLAQCTLLGEPLVLVVGAEGRGVSRTLLHAADARVAIQTSETFSTLNASVAGAIAMYEVTRSRTASGG